MKKFELLFIIITIILFYSCSGSKNAGDINISYDSFPKLITLPPIDTVSMNKYNRDVPGIEKTITKENGKSYQGFITNNNEFYREIMKPALISQIDKLRNLTSVQLINALTIFGHEMFRTYFGKDFYRWAGDINDLDDPQSRLHRFNFRYGLDCSGFASLPYEIAVDLGLMDYKNGSAIFSHKGFEYYCTKNNFKDSGGRDNTSNNFRLDTKDIGNLGRVIFTLEKDGIPTEEQISKLQPGDLVSKTGHVGIIIKIKDKTYYLESGGTVVPKHDGLPCRAFEALRLFAKNGQLTVRRSLPDITQ
jgi:hypothetical protein